MKVDLDRKDQLEKNLKFKLEQITGELQKERELAAKATTQLE